MIKLFTIITYLQNISLTTPIIFKSLLGILFTTINQVKVKILGFQLLKCDYFWFLFSSMNKYIWVVRKTFGDVISGFGKH